MGEVVEPDIRTLEQMKPVLYDPESDGPDELYYMYRGVHLRDHDELVAGHNVRYDLTVIPSAVIGGEFTKTKGHFHPKKGEHTWPEIYEVISGEAHYLFQDSERVLVFHATAGDKVIVPPNFGHVTINSSKKTLVMANWVSPDFSSDYGPFIEKRGAAFYELEKTWVGNPRYEGVSLEMMKPGHHNCQFFTKKKSMYDLFCEDPDCFKFLNEPELCFKK